MTGDEDDRQSAVHFQKLLLQLEPAETRHADIEDETARPIRRVAGQKLVAGMKDLVLEPHGTHEEFHRVPDRLIVVDDKYR